MIDTCPVCHEDVQHDHAFGGPYGAPWIICPDCGAELRCEYDEGYDPETGEESNWAALVKADR